MGFLQVTKTTFKLSPFFNNTVFALRDRKTKIFILKIERQYYYNEHLNMCYKIKRQIH